MEPRSSASASRSFIGRSGKHRDVKNVPYVDPVSRSTSSDSSGSRSSSRDNWSHMLPPPAARVKVTLTDDELTARSERAAARLDFPRLDNPGSASTLKRWTSSKTSRFKKRSESFATFSRRSERSKVSLLSRATTSFKSKSGKQPEDLDVDDDDDVNNDDCVVAVGELTCSLRELQYILSTGSDAEHNAMARLLYGKHYIYGSVVHATEPGSHSENPAEVKKASVVVKTGAFVHSGLFGANEQWCYLETFEKSSNDDAFTVTLASLDERDLVVGKMKAGHVDSIARVTAGFRVERIPSSPLVRVIFSGRSANPLADSHLSLSRTDRRAAKLAREHLKRMSSAVTRLPETVRARRLGFQTLADRTAFVANNSHCTCCTKVLHLLALVNKKKQCHLCGYGVCDDCWSIHRIETRQGQLATVRVCRRCLEFIDKGDFSNVTRPSREGSAGPRILPDAENAEPSGKVLTRLLHDALNQSQSAKQRSSVISLIKHLVTEDKQTSKDKSLGSEPTAHRLTEEGMEVGSYSGSITSSNADDRQADAMLEALQNEPSMPLDACELANNESRAYPLRVAETPDQPSEAPIPDDEDDRLKAIERNRLMSITDTDELDIICDLIAREMKCSTGLVTLIDNNSQKVLASNIEPLRQLSMPRNHSFCQHTVMARAPLLAPHPEADVRFQNLPPLHQMGLRFYFGFPLFGANNAVVGSVCCLDQSTHEVTQAQYSAMQRLASTASKIVQVKGRAKSSAGISTSVPGTSAMSSSVPIPVL